MVKKIIMENLKYVLFLEIIVIFLTAAVHLTATILGKPFPLIIYPIMIGIILVVTLFVVYIVHPFAEWFLN